jgi:anti-anti-sigma regulatory factor
VAISFFKKGKDKSAEAPAPREVEADLTQMLGAPPDNGGIIVDESSGAPETSLDEAAILFANDQADAAEAKLKSTLANNEPRTWHMLFDLYRLQTRERDFEKLALDYALRFETSPPVWQGVKAAKVDAVESKASSASLPSLLDAKACANLRTELAQAPHNTTIRLDFSRIEMVDETGAGQCAEILANSQKIKHKFQVSGVERLIQLLQDLNRATHTRASHWLLLLELFQLLGRKDEFEDLAVNYAVHFEVSPPSWIETSAAQVVQVPEPPPVAADDALALSGEISSKNEAAFELMTKYAADHANIVLDMSQVTRVDYGTVSSLLGLLMQWLGEGKTITIRGHHTFIHELFRIMNIDQLAQLQPAKII